MAVVDHGIAGETQEGGHFLRLLNRTGAPSVKGTVVVLSPAADFAFAVAGADDFSAMGVVYESGLADGELCPVVVEGVADVLIEDGTAATRGNWVRTSVTVGGRADATNAAPPGLVLQHFAEIGHCLQSVGVGVGVLCRIVLHFN